MLAGLKEVVAEGKKRNIAIGSFNTPNLECLLAVLDAAEELDVPVIIAHAQCHEDVAPLDKIGPVMVELAKRSKVKVCVHLDHGEDFEYCKRAMELGFTSVMIDYSTLPYEENVKGTKSVVDYAHANGVDVEAELGALPQREGGGDNAVVNPADLYTKPELVPEFLANTGVDALAIAFGTAHGIYKTKPVLKMDVITKVRELTDLPLVMHGGSGISPEEYKEVIRCGIGKINYYSYMSYAGYAEAKTTIDNKEADFFHNLALNVQNAMKENALKTLKVFSNME
jgi:fructose-bisphosphate aldolase class II